MPLPLFEALCVVVVVTTLWAMARLRPRREVLADWGVLAVAAWAGEDACVQLYRHYAYAPGWHLRVHHVPVLVAVIWPLVILSARDVCDALFPGVGRLRPLVVGAVVAFDASLVEVLSVRAGLWGWAEGGHLGVPVVGILGWGYFAAASDLTLRRGRLIALLFAPLLAHALIVGSWWLVFRWTLRGALGDASLLWVGIVGLAGTAFVLGARRAGRAMPPAVAWPRVLASVLFVALFLLTAPSDARLWIHAGAVALPYLAATRFRG